MIITITDVRRAGFCARGAKIWFEGQGFDFRAFLKDGIGEEAMLATGDARAAQVVERAHARLGITP